MNTYTNDVDNCDNNVNIFLVIQFFQIFSLNLNWKRNYTVYGWVKMELVFLSNSYVLLPFIRWLFNCIYFSQIIQTYLCKILFEFIYLKISYIYIDIIFFFFFYFTHNLDTFYFLFFLITDDNHFFFQNVEMFNQNCSKSFVWPPDKLLIRHIIFVWISSNKIFPKFSGKTQLLLETSKPRFQNKKSRIYGFGFLTAR